MTFSKDNRDLAVAAGRRGAAARWARGPRRVVRLTDLTPEQRRLVLALIDAVRTAT